MYAHHNNWAIPDRFYEIIIDLCKITIQIFNIKHLYPPIKQTERKECLLYNIL